MTEGSYTPRQIATLVRKAQLYDALTAEPGDASADTLTHWHRLVLGTQEAVGDRLTNRLSRIAAHLHGGGNPNAGEHDPSLRD